MKKEELEKISNLVHEKIAFEKFEHQQERKKSQRTFITIFLCISIIVFYSGNNLKEKSTTFRNQTNNASYNTSTNDIKEYPNYYGGFYIENDYFVILLTENTLENQEKIKELLEINEKTRFETVKYSYKKLAETKASILNNNYSFIEKVEINIKENCIDIVRNPATEENKENLLEKSEIFCIEKRK